MRLINIIINKIERLISKVILSNIENINLKNSSIEQRLLSEYYQIYSIQSSSNKKLSDVGWKVYSQSNEDGILHYIFSIIGKVNKKCIELCAGDAKECNTINLILNDFWVGLLVDGNQDNVKKGKTWLRKHPSTYVYPPKFICQWITKENINQIIQENGFDGEIDLLSIDVDGVDYWLWEAINVVQPRVVVIEYQQHLGPNKSLSIPYSADFNAWTYPVSGWLPNYAGASLKALNKLATKKGYRLIGCNNYCFNAFFIKSDILAPSLPTVSVESCFQHPRAQWSIENRFTTVEHLEWVQI